MCLRLILQTRNRDVLMASVRLGIAIPAINPMMATTTMTSMSVKAMLLLHRERMPRLLEHL